MIESKEEFNYLLNNLKAKKKENRLGKSLQAKLQAFQEVEELINLPISGVGCSLPTKDAFISRLETTIKEKHKGCDELEKELLKLGGLYAYRIVYDLMTK